MALASQVDIKLCHMVNYFNEQLKLVNRFKTPRISQDIITSSKGIGQEYTTYRKKLELIYRWDTPSESFNQVMAVHRACDRDPVRITSILGLVQLYYKYRMTRKPCLQ